MNGTDRKVVWAASIGVMAVIWLCVVMLCSDPLYKFFYPEWRKSNAAHPSDGIVATWLFLVAPVLAAAITWGFIGRLIKLGKLPEKRRMAREEERWRVKAEADRIKQHRAEQRQLASRLENLLRQSTASARELPNLIAEAERSLDLAEYECGRRAFVPFWDAIEAAAKKLATVEMTLQRLIQNSQFYQKDVSELETPAPLFQIGLDTLPDASHTANRMRELYSRTDTDFEFTSIYQQRTTNKLLIAGFSTMTQAIEELPDRLQSSLGQLASSVSIGISDLASRLASSQERMTLALAREIRKSDDQSAGDAAAQRKDLRKLSEAADNIQRRKMPRPHRLGDGEY
jgi:myosin heavy subunit